MRILALDIGDRRIGVAVSDPTGLIARPLAIIIRKDDHIDIQTIAELAHNHGVECIIVGLPLSLDGYPGPQADKVRCFTTKLATATNTPLEFRDERFSTITAREYRLGSGVGRKKRRAPDDDTAAAVILQSYLDETRSHAIHDSPPML